MGDDDYSWLMDYLSNGGNLANINWNDYGYGPGETPSQEPTYYEPPPVVSTEGGLPGGLGSGAAEETTAGYLTPQLSPGSESNIGLGNLGVSFGIGNGAATGLNQAGTAVTGSTSAPGNVFGGSSLTTPAVGASNGSNGGGNSGNSGGGNGSGGNSGTGTSGGSGGIDLGQLLSFLGPLLGGATAYNATSKGAEYMQQAIKDANAIATGANDKTQAMWSPYVQAGTQALGNLQNFKDSDLASKYGPVGSTSNLAAKYGPIGVGGGITLGDFASMSGRK